MMTNLQMYLAVAKSACGIQFHSSVLKFSNPISGWYTLFDGTLQAQDTL